MEDKKNIPFVSGLALILSALALLLIGINQVNPSPYDQEMEKIVEKRFNDIESRLDMRITARLQQLDRAEQDAALRELKMFKTQLQDWINSGAANAGYSDQVLTIAKQIDALVKQMETKDTAPLSIIPPPPSVTPPPPAATPEAAPATPAPAAAEAPAAPAAP